VPGGGLREAFAGEVERRGAAAFHPDDDRSAVRVGKPDLPSRTLPDGHVERHRVEQDSVL
jgi:hypothetical protein